MKNFKKFTAFVLALCMLFSLSVAAFAAEVDEHTIYDSAPDEETVVSNEVATSGTIQNSGIRWDLDNKGWLTISGSGEAPVFTSADDQPWAAVRDQITEVWFEDVETLTIPDLAYWFEGCVNLTTAELPLTPVIGRHAFYNCPLLTKLSIYYGEHTLDSIGEDAFWREADSGDTLYVAYIIGYPDSSVPFHDYDWTASNRSNRYFYDLYGVYQNADAATAGGIKKAPAQVSTRASTGIVGTCPSCKQYSLQGTYVSTTHTSRGHAEYYECYKCHYTKNLGTYVYKDHGSGSYGSWTCPDCGSHSWVLDYESDATCTRNGYREYSCDCGQSKRETVYATGHNYSYGSWEQYSSSQHRRENYCRYCGATDYDYASHSYSYGSWSSAGSSQHSRSMTCRYCGYSDTQYASHSLSYGSWSSHSDTQHRRTGSCTTCSYSTTDYGAHTFSYGSWTDHSSTQHRRTKRCTSCSYSGYDYADHVDSNGDGVCDGCGREMSRFSVTVPASLTVTVSEHGVVYTATGAGIVNNSSSAVQVSGVTLRAENGWTIVPYATNMAAQKVDSKKIGFALDRMQTAATGKSELLTASSMTISAGATLPLSYDAVVSASSAAINEQVLTIVFVVGWA